MKKELIDSFGEMIIEARNVGIQTFLELESKEWIPKNPDEQQKNVVDFINSLNEEQKNQFKNGLGYFMDLSFFKLINSLENGYEDIDFTLTASDSADSTDLINDEEDNELTQKYWEWLSKYGIKGTTSW